MTKKFEIRELKCVKNDFWCFFSLHKTISSYFMQVKYYFFILLLPIINKPNDNLSL